MITHKALSLLTAVSILLFTACAQPAKNAKTAPGSETSAPEPPPTLTVTGEMELSYAKMFSVRHCDGGYELINIGDDSYLLVPENADIPPDSSEYTVIRQPLDNIYLAASSAMDLFIAIDGLGSIGMTSTEVDDWSLPKVVNAIADEDICYVGKYSAPDYEFLTSERCPLAIESTMIYHTPEVREQLEALGIPVMVERSSYETHPLGRMEWIKLYGLLTGKYAAAEQFFNEKAEIFNSMELTDLPQEERQTAAFFYVSPNGYVNIRKPGDYISQMIELAGGKYLFTAADLEVSENALSTMNIQLEVFYEKAKDADVLIYNSTTTGELETLDELKALSPVFAEMKAMKNGNVWCTNKNMFQQTTCAAEMTKDLNLIFTGKTEETTPTYLHKLR